MQITLIKRTDAQIAEADREPMRRFLFEMVQGATERDSKAWKRWIRALNEASAGTYFQITIKRQRSTQFHKLCFAVILAAYKVQDRFEDMDVFRAYLKLGAGHVVYVPDEKTGELKAIPRSQSFEDCSEDEAREFFDAMCVFLRSPTCCATLWPQTPVETSMAGMESLLRQFDMQ